MERATVKGDAMCARARALAKMRMEMGADKATNPPDPRASRGVLVSGLPVDTLNAW